MNSMLFGEIFFFIFFNLSGLLFLIWFLILLFVVCVYPCAFPLIFNFYFSRRFVLFACLFSKERGKDSIKFGWVGCGEDLGGGEEGRPWLDYMVLKKTQPKIFFQKKGKKEKEEKKERPVFCTLSLVWQWDTGREGTQLSAGFVRTSAHIVRWVTPNFEDNWIRLQN